LEGLFSYLMVTDHARKLRKTRGDR
jgi:hypothetical protein